MKKEKIIGIYIITNLINKMVYIGQSRNIIQRWREHRSFLRGNVNRENSHLQNAWNKYGEENFEFKVLENCIVENLNEKEIYYIAKYESNNRSKGYNNESGGNANKNVSIETRNKISKNHANVNGINNPYYGKKHSKETREKIKKNHVNFKGENHPRTDLTTENVLSIKNMLLDGKPIKQIAKIFKINDQCVYRIRSGKTWSETTGIFNINTIKSREIVQMDKNENFIKIWSNIKQIKDSLKILSISYACRNIKHSAGSFKWMHIDDYIKTYIN